MFDLMINLGPTTALGLKIAPALLLGARVM
jgi:hypothetical protein